MNLIDNLRESILEAQVEAALQGHALTPFEPLDKRGYQAVCRQCEGSVWVGSSGLIYSILSETCSPPPSVSTFSQE